MPLPSSLRQHLSPRVLPSKHPSHYAIFTWDGETQSSWTVTRPYSSFQSLKTTLYALRPSVSQVPLTDTCASCDKFLRKVTSLWYTSNLHPSFPEVQSSIQSFLSTPTSFPPPPPPTSSGPHLYLLRVLQLPVFSLLLKTFTASLLSRSPTPATVIKHVAQNTRQDLKTAAEGVTREMSDFGDKVREPLQGSLTMLRRHVLELLGSCAGGTSEPDVLFASLDSVSSIC